MKKRDLLREGNIGNNQENFNLEIVKIGLEDIYDKLVTISHALRTIIDPFS